MSFVDTLLDSYPEFIAKPLSEFFSDYEASCKKNSIDTKSMLPIIEHYLKAVEKQLQEPFSFEPYHRQINSFYTLGLDFVRPMIDLTNSKVFGEKALEAIESNLAAKENVILLSNHQTEIDPQVISLLIEKSHPELAKKMIFVAGHRVTTDPLAVPFSLGRNLICIYSKRHMAENRAEKQLHNQKAIKSLSSLLQEGGNCIYVAPSGGRDRLKSDGHIEVAPFDPDAVEMFSLLAKRAKTKTHFFTLTLDTFQLLPPPSEVSKTLGEKRTTSFSPAKLYFGSKLDLDQTFTEDRKKNRELRAKAIYQTVCKHYEEIQLK